MQALKNIFAIGIESSTCPFTVESGCVDILLSNQSFVLVKASIATHFLNPFVLQGGGHFMFTEKKNRETYIAILKISFHSIKSNSCERYDKLKPAGKAKGERLLFSFLNGMTQITAASALSLSVFL